MIDARAVVDPAAEIDEGVHIGPFSIIGPGVSIGAGTRIGPHVVIGGETRIGRDNEIFQFSSIGEDPQDKKYAGEATRLEIGDRNRIREFATIHRGTVQDGGVTRIGDDNLFMAYTHVAHDCQIGSHVIMANAASLGGHVRLDDWAILGGFAIVHQFCRIGAHSFAAMGSVISKGVPPYVMVAGHPARARGLNLEGLRRRDFGSEQIARIKQAYRLVYSSDLLVKDAVSRIEAEWGEYPEIQRFVQFLRACERSCIR
ncbi:acyl-ACP--UDP-N-acetylglucosamine O-acyltransferase [endosymbiont of unidentified scaly snail isolate Monju]|uniref:acyl-ACP--UDP-N-acetylglucosamine O-acyltransferase n=1 Tax=endosymbiont of unidentified scaly snail isolate Monju TaxID=1248727 RepID=UPI000389221F|nr:acyl-ACP--UDP-N-acetylglucosamine O-acyltransferase [endosymbiont of unidentified scaly snail isolate Monju]BAN68676.1 UDP-N-acetylglucosamine acyltransferase [endosymbiont of unidentified scaly snail isolate Monju]